MKSLRTTVILLAGSLLTAAGYPGLLGAADLPGQKASGIASEYRERGKIDSVEVMKNHIVIDDSNYRLAPSLVVYNQHGGRDYASSLRKGKRVAFYSKKQAGSPDRVIYEIAILSGK